MSQVKLSVIACTMLGAVTLLGSVPATTPAHASGNVVHRLCVRPIGPPAHHGVVVVPCVVQP